MLEAQDQSLQAVSQKELELPRFSKKAQSLLR